MGQAFQTFLPLIILFAIMALASILKYFVFKWCQDNKFDYEDPYVQDKRPISAFPWYVRLYSHLAR